MLICAEFPLLFLARYVFVPGTGFEMAKMPGNGRVLLKGFRGQLGEGFVLELDSRLSPCSRPVPTCFLLSRDKTVRRRVSVE